MYAQVLVELKAKQINQTFTYHIPNNLNVKVGSRVLVPFGKQKLEGFVLKITKEIQEKYTIKDIEKLIDDDVIFNDELLKLGIYIQNKTMCNLIHCYQTMVPSALKANKNNNINKKIEKYIYLNVSYEEALKNCKSKAQVKIIEQLSNPMLRSEANKISKSATETLLKNKIITIKEQEIYRVQYNEIKEYVPKKLTEEQQNAYDTISKSLNKFQPFLLHGVTGSGKTEVYLSLIEEVLKQKKQALVLVPEISLTPQFVSQFTSRFKDTIAVLHSGLSNGEKYDEWRRIKRKEASIVIGARSAIFAPLDSIGIIIIDEEHSNTYKQENNPKYYTIDIANFRGKYHKCPVVLGSATPSLESYTRAKLGIYKLIEMKNRISKSLPKVLLVDMKDEYKKGYNILSKKLIDKINDRIEKKEQIMLLLNRRGYTTVTICKNCGYVHKCPACDIPYTYHKKNNSYICHYCGSITSPLFKCPKCQSTNIDFKGMGTEKLEQYLTDLFKVPVLRMDADTTSKKGSHDRIIKEFKNQNYSILLGTQMIAKGLDFPNVTLVGVLNGDAILNIPDFRSSERTYQLLSQVAGRAGRSTKKGEVIIQGFSIDHFSMLCAANHDYKSFYNQEMKLRKQLKYSPYYNLCLLKFSGKNEDAVYREAEKVVVYLKNQNLKDLTVLGPSISLLGKINNVYYYQILLKYKQTKNLYQHLKFVKNQFQNKNINLDIDFNP